MTEKVKSIETGKTLYFDSTDLEGMRKIMDDYHDYKYPFIGKNQDGEATTIAVFEDTIVLLTYQSNKWVRKNYYYRDGSSEETFEGKWEI